MSSTYIWVTAIRLETKPAYHAGDTGKPNLHQQLWGMYCVPYIEPKDAFNIHILPIATMVYNGH